MDDVFASLFDWADTDQADGMLAYLDSLHAEFDCNMDLYVFLHSTIADTESSLAQLPTSLRVHFASRPWLRVGPHGERYETPPFAQSLHQQLATLEQIYAQVDRFAGHAARARWVRLHYFSECLEIAPFLQNQGIQALLMTDRDAVSYRLDARSCQQLKDTGIAQHQGLALRRSFVRIESMVSQRWDAETIASAFRDRLSSHGYVALFTHEVELQRPEVREAMRRCIEILHGLGAVSC